jgi:penicillin-binding protein activator
MQTSPKGRQHWLVLGICLLTLTACSTTGTRVPPEAPVGISGRWNDTDSRLTAQAMVKEALGSPWPQRFSQLMGRTPVVTVGTVLNRTHEQLNTQTFVQDLERALMQSGTVKPLGQEAGADFMLQGTINSLVDELDSTRAVFYQVDLELIDMASNVKVWQGQKKVKKFVKPNKTTL